MPTETNPGMMLPSRQSESGKTGGELKAAKNSTTSGYEQDLTSSISSWNIILPVLQSKKAEYLSLLTSKREGLEYLDKSRNWVSVISFAAQILNNDGAVNNPEHASHVREFIGRFTSSNLRGRSFSQSELRIVRKTLDILLSLAPE